MVNLVPSGPGFSTKTLGSVGFKAHGWPVDAKAKNVEAMPSPPSLMGAKTAVKPQKLLSTARSLIEEAHRKRICRRFAEGHDALLRTCVQP